MPRKGATNLGRKDRNTQRVTKSNKRKADNQSSSSDADNDTGAESSGPSCSAPQPAKRRRQHVQGLDSEVDSNESEIDHDHRVTLDSEATSDEEQDGIVDCSNVGTIFEQPTCSYCSAYVWPFETPGFCCNRGKVKVPDIQEPPPELVQIYDVSRTFRQNFRTYNNLFALASLGCTEIACHGFSPVLKICGKVYHKIGSLMPVNGNIPRFAQLYFHDTDNELQNRLNTARNETDIDPLVVADLQRILHNVNPYVSQIKKASLLAANVPEFRVKLTTKYGYDKTYSLPTSSEFAGIQPAALGGMMEVIFERDGVIKRINELNGLYDPLHYVLLFPNGDEGFDLNLQKASKGPTAAEFYRYRLQVRDKDKTSNWIMKGKRGTQEYAIDQFTKIENSRFRFHELVTSQQKYRAATFSALTDDVADDSIGEPGKRIILPSSHQGSPRWFHKSYLDAMSIVRRCGKPDLFLTFTCNPDWPEIKGSLFPGEQPQDRPDIICRVFHQKVQELVRLIKQGNIFGRVVAYVLTKEDQKRGLPHIHMVIFLHKDDKLKTPRDVDKVIRAEIPDKDRFPKLFEIVRKFNVHGPCTKEDSCKEEGTQCTKGFPKPFNNGRTKFGGNYYPEYRRRDFLHGGKQCTKMHRNKEFTVDNSSVVPYCPTLSEGFDAHINVEAVHSVKAVKYLFKYITKGTDKTCFSVQPEGNDRTPTVNEVTDFQDGRYVSSTNAFWRLYEFPIMIKEPSVVQLQLHLPDEEWIIFRDGEAEDAVDRGPPITQLTAYFALNRDDPHARTVLYPDITRYYRWDAKEKSWQRRKRNSSRFSDRSDGGPTSDQIGRIPSVHINARNAERFYLRTLLYNVAGSTSFEELRTVNGRICATFREACLERGLLEDDYAITQALDEAATFRIGPDLRTLFVTLLVFCEPKDPVALWEQFKDALAEDIKRQRGGDEITEADVNAALHLIQLELMQHDLDITIHFGIAAPAVPQSNTVFPTVYDIPQLKVIHEENLKSLTRDQKEVYGKVLESIEENLGICFGLEASGGCGKTFLITTILAKVRSEGHVAIATAISGIAALLLPEGRTAHSQLKIPIELEGDSCCDISPRGALADTLRSCKFLVFDEYPQAHKHLYEAVDRSLRDITGVDKIFGGITVLLSGDWKQVLPVVKRGTDADTIDATLKRSTLWSQVQSLKLDTNMRVNSESAEKTKRFVDYQLAIGEGRIPEDKDGYIPILPDFQLEDNSLEGLCDFVYSEFDQNYKNINWLCSRAILCPTNEIVNQVNDLMLARIPGEPKTLLSADAVSNTDQPDDFPIEYLNTIDPSGMPLHRLHLKVGSPVMLLRNLDSRRGHCNGSRYVVTSIGDYVLDCTVAFGPHVGERKFIPKIKLKSNDKFMPFCLERIQFPLKLCFGITTNKAQGQSLKQVGLYLKQDVFAHGQLYVALSRATDPDKIKIVRPDDNTRMKNVVYKQIFRN